MGHESGQGCETVFNIIRNYGEAFSTFSTFYLETDRFLPIIGDKSRQSDLN